MGAERRMPGRAEAVLLASGMFGNVAMSCISPALPKIERAFAGVDNVEYLTKLTVSAVGLGVILISPMTGFLVRRFGRQRVMVGAYLVFLLVGTAGFLLPSLPLLIASRFITGAAGAVIVATGLILIGDHYQGAARERRIGASHAIGALLVGIVVQLAGFLADLNWRYAFFVHLAALPMLLFALSSPELDRPEVAAAPVNKDAPDRLPPVIWLIALVTLMAGAIGYSVQIFTPFHLRNIGADSAALAGTTIVITLIASILTSLVYGEIRRFLSPAAVFALGFFGWSAGLALTAWSTSVTGVLLAMAVIGLGGGVMGPNIFSLVSAVTPDGARPRAIGLMKGIYYFGPFVGPTALQLLDLHRRAETALFSLSIFGAVFGAACLVGAGVLRGPRGDPEAQIRAAFEAEA
jgi:MFS family permease